MMAKQIVALPNRKLYKDMHAENPPLVVKHYKGGIYLNPRFVQLVGSGVHSPTFMVAYIAGRGGQEYVTDLERFFGLGENGVMRFTEVLLGESTPSSASGAGEEQ